jgi:hypothetical protein
MRITVRKWVIALFAMMVVIVDASGSPINVAGQEGAWTIYIKTDEMNDNQWYGAKVRSDSGARLSIEIFDTGYERIYYEDSTPGGTNSISWRVDRKPAHSGVTELYTTSSGFYMHGKQTISLFEEMAGGATLSIKTYGSDDASVFNIQGASEALQKAREGSSRLRNPVK